MEIDENYLLDFAEDIKSAIDKDVTAYLEYEQWGRARPPGFLDGLDTGIEIANNALKRIIDRDIEELL